jgi:hypothetical protein
MLTCTHPQYCGMLAVVLSLTKMPLYDSGGLTSELSGGDWHCGIPHL